MQRLGTITLRSQRFQLLRVKRPLMVDGVQCDGKCDPPDRKRRTIQVVERLDPERELDVFIHEMLHACFWDLDENSVSEAATDIARVLRSIGYRKR